MYFRSIVANRDSSAFDIRAGPTFVIISGTNTRLVQGIREQKVGRTLLLLLKLPPLGKFLLAWFRRFLERKDDVRVSTPWMEKAIL